MAHIKATGIAAHIAVTNGEPTTTTQDIAEVYGKQHAKVLAIVRQRMSEAGEWGVANFSETPYTNPQNGQTYTVIRMTEKGFHFVVGKFTGAKAVRHQIAYADEFQRMKAELAQPTVSLSPAPLNHQQINSTRSLQTTARQMGAFAAAVGLQVQMVVLDMMAQGRTTAEVDASLANHRWMVHFDPTGKACASEIPRDAVVMSIDELAQAIPDEAALPATNAQLAALALACHQRLATRLTVNKNRQTKHQRRVA